MGAKFDLRTQIMNKKGQITTKQPYRLFIENGVRKFERNGVFYTEDGSVIEVLKKKHNGKSSDLSKEAKETLLSLEKQETEQ